MHSTTLLLLLPFCLCTVQGELTAEQYAETFVQQEVASSVSRTAAQAPQPNPGPIVETGRFHVVSSKLMRGAEMPQSRNAPVNPSLDANTPEHLTPLHREPVQQLPHHEANRQPIYRYDGPLDGRKVWIYKKILRPVRITSHGVERLPGAQVVDQWAEGGYGNQLAGPMRAPIYAPTNNGFYTQTMADFAHA